MRGLMIPCDFHCHLSRSERTPPLILHIRGGCSGFNYNFSICHAKLSQTNCFLRQYRVEFTSIYTGLTDSKSIKQIEFFVWHFLLLSRIFPVPIKCTAYCRSQINNWVMRNIQFACSWKTVREWLMRILITFDL